MTGHLEELLVAIVAWIRNWLGLSSRSPQMIPVRVRSQSSLISCQSQRTDDPSHGEPSALLAWPEVVRRQIKTSSCMSRAGSASCCSPAPSDDL